MNLRVAKYWQVFVTQVKTLKEYNIEFVLKLARQPLKIMLLIIFWKAVFELTGKETIAGLAQGEFIMYIVIASTIAFSFHPWTVYGIVDDHVKRGKLSLVITRPVRHIPYVFSKSVLDTIVDLLLPIPVVLAIMWTGLFGITYIVPSSLFLGLSIVSFLLASYLAFMLYYTISVTMFWTGDLWSIWGTLEGLQALLSGQVIPLTIAPILQTIANVFPFPAMIFTPSYMFIGKFSLQEALMGIGVQVLWIVGLTIVSSYLWNRGLKKFDAQGG